MKGKTGHFSILQSQLIGKITWRIVCETEAKRSVPGLCLSQQVCLNEQNSFH